MENEIREEVKEYYGKSLQTSDDLKTNACCIGGSTAYTPKEKEVLGKIHEDIIKKFYGCGSPIPQGIEGAQILDLGCGTGRDCFLASAMVG
jgi:arsenite methyltransferase